jgi:hypothetical protein
MFIIHPLAAKTNKVADFQHISMENYVSKAHTEGIFCVLCTLRADSHIACRAHAVPLPRRAARV